MPKDQEKKSSSTLPWGKCKLPSLPRIRVRGYFQSQRSEEIWKPSSWCSLLTASCNVTIHAPGYPVHKVTARPAPHCPCTSLPPDRLHIVKPHWYSSTAWQLPKDYEAQFLGDVLSKHGNYRMELKGGCTLNHDQTQTQKEKPHAAQAKKDARCRLRTNLPNKVPWSLHLLTALVSTFI